MTSFTITLTGNSNELSASIYPEINLDDGFSYSCGLLGFTSYHSVPNITPANNSVRFGSFEDGKVYECKIPEGSYEAEDILVYMKKVIEEHGFSFQYKINKNTLKTFIQTSTKLIFSPHPSIYEVLGYERKDKNDDHVGNKVREWFESHNVIQISKLNVVRVECNIATGAYVNGRLCHTIYEFANNKVDPGYKIIEQPENIVYLPIVPRRINNVQINIVDQDGNPVDFRGETITCRIHIKRDDA